MSLQIFLWGKIHGVEDFLRNSAGDFEGRAQWATLLSETLPRELLAELGLSKMLLGSSGGDQFLLVIPEEFLDRAVAFCDRAGAEINQRTGGVIRLAYASTENLGTWSDIRKRLATDLHAALTTPAVGTPGFFGQDITPAATFEVQLRPEGADIPYADHTAPEDPKRGLWGVLRGDVDAFGQRLSRAVTVDEHLQLSLMYKHFVANELQMRCSLPEFWQHVNVLYASGQSFAVVGKWDALIGLAREMQRIFALFVDSNLREYAGTEGKTISMAIALADKEDASVGAVYADAGDKLELAKASGRDSIWVLGRTLEWKQLADAAESRNTMTRLIREFGASRQFLDELAAFYRDSSDTIMTPGARRTNTRVDKPWRFYRRLNSVLAASGRSREYQRLRSDLISDFTGKRASNIRLRPQGRVALEWARLETE